MRTSISAQKGGQFFYCSIAAANPQWMAHGAQYMLHYKHQHSLYHKAHVPELSEFSEHPSFEHQQRSTNPEAPHCKDLESFISNLRLPRISNHTYGNKKLELSRSFIKKSM